MAQVRRVGSLEIGEDLPFSRRQWAVQRAGWWVMLLLLILGLLGVFGGGVLSHAEATAGPLTLRYERFARQRRPTSLELQFAPGASAGEDEVAVWVDRRFLDAVDIEWITPDPAESLAGADMSVYRFALADASQPAQVTIAYQPAEVGVTPIRLGLPGGDEIDVDQLTWP